MFRCAYCKKVYISDKDFTEEDRKKEFNNNFPELKDFPELEDQRVEICDDCYNRFIIWFKTLSENDKMIIIEEELNSKKYKKELEKLTKEFAKRFIGDN